MPPLINRGRQYNINIFLIDLYVCKCNSDLVCYLFVYMSSRIMSYNLSLPESYNEIVFMDV